MKHFSRGLSWPKTINFWRVTTYLLTYSSCSLLSFSIVGYVCIRHSDTKMKNGSIFYFWIWMPSNMYMCGIYNIHTVNPTSIHFIFLKKIDKNGFWILGPFFENSWWGIQKCQNSRPNFWYFIPIYQTCIRADKNLT